MIDEKRIDEIAEKITQAVRIKSTLIEQNTKAIALIKDKKKESRIKGTEILRNNCEREYNLLVLLNNGAKETLNVISKFKESDDAKYLGPETQKLINIIIESMDFFIHKSTKIIEERLEYEKKYLEEYSFVMEKYYLMILKRKWNKELLADYKLYKMLTSEIESNEKFWSDISTKIKQLPKGQLKKQLGVPFVTNNIYPAIVANALSLGFVAFNPDMNTADKALTVTLLWCLSGFFTRSIHVVATFKRICGLADVMYKSNILNQLQPKNMMIK